MMGASALLPDHTGYCTSTVRLQCHNTDLKGFLSYDVILPIEGKILMAWGWAREGDTDDREKEKGRYKLLFYYISILYPTGYYYSKVRIVLNQILSHDLF